MKKSIPLFLFIFTAVVYATTFHPLIFDGTNEFHQDETFQTSTPGYNAYCTWDDTYLYLGYSGEIFGETNDTTRIETTIFWYIDTDPNPENPKSGLGTSEAINYWVNILPSPLTYYDQQVWELPFYADYFVKENTIDSDSAVALYGDWIPDSSDWNFIPLDTTFANLNLPGEYYEVRIPWDSLGNPSEINILGHLVSGKWTGDLGFGPPPDLIPFRDVMGSYGSWPANSLEGGDGDKQTEGKFNHWYSFHLTDGISPDQENDPPYISNIPGQTIDEGQTFPGIPLDDFVLDDLTPDSLINWSYVGNTDLSIVIDSDRVATVSTPHEDWNGMETITWTATDEGSATGDDQDSYIVNAVNDAPVAVNDSAKTKHETLVAVNVIANDSDIDGDTLTVSKVLAASHGTVAIQDDSTVTHISEAGFSGADSFKYVISDGNGGVDTANVHITVNDHPTAVDDQSDTNEETAVTINVLTNDSDVEGDSIWVFGLTQPTHGSAVNNADSTVTYTPETDFFGTDSFTYFIDDGIGGTDTAQVLITVNPVNDPPVAINDSAKTARETLVAVNVIANDSDIDGDTLTVSKVLAASHGTVAIQDDSTVTHISEAGFSGADSFKYVISDGNGGVDTANVHITVNDHPTAVDDQSDTNEETAVTINVLTNDSDVEGDSIWVFGLTQPTHGSAVNNADSTVTYTPETDFFGTDSFTYFIDDGIGGTDTAQVLITVNPVNDPPVAVNDTALTQQDSAIEINVIINDTDIDNDTLTVAEVMAATNGSIQISGDSVVIYTPSASFYGDDNFEYVVSDGHGGTDTALVVIKVNGKPVAVNDTTSTSENTSVTLNVILNDNDPDGGILSVIETLAAAHGTVLNNNDSTVTYTPETGYFGADSFQYVIDDGSGGIDTALVHASINGNPIAADDETTTAEDSTLSVVVLANDSDPENDTLSVIETTNGDHGTTAIQNDSTVSYTPDADYNGSDSFTYIVSDGNGGTDTATVSVNVTAVNDAPLAVNDEISTTEDTPVTFNVLQNDSDVDSDTVSVTEVMQAQHGTVIDNHDSTLTYTPDADFFGADSFNYVISDGNGLNDTAMVSVTVESVNDPVTAVNDTVSIDEDAQIVIVVLANDSDGDGDVLSLVIADDPPNGTVAIDGDTSITYTPDQHFYGEDSLQYVMTDGNGSNDSAMVFITVRSVNDPPEIVNLPDNLTIQINDSTKLSIAQYASDVDTPDSLLVWSFDVDDPAISYSYDSGTDNLTIYASATQGDYSLYCTLTDDSSASDNDTIAIHVEDPNTTFDMYVLKEWNMIGLPLTVEDNHYKTLFPNAMDNTLYNFDGAYQLDSTLDAGVGYWLRFPDADTVTIEGTEISSVILDLMEGWNMISGPSCNVPLNTVDDPGGIIMENTLYEFTGSYELSDTISQGKGYWLRASQAGQITLSCGAQKAQVLAKAGLDLSANSSIEITDAEGKSITLYAGVELKDASQKLQYSLPPLPPISCFDARFTGGYRVTDKLEGTIKLQANAFPVTINVNNLSAAEGYRYVFKGYANGREAFESDLSTSSSIVIRNSGVDKITFNSDKIIPREFAVYQNYPNPFNPTTEIKYTLPSKEHVQIVIYNIVGQKVKTLVSKEQEAGIHKISWDGTNNMGRKLSSGIYIYAVTVGHHKSVKKMALIK